MPAMGALARAVAVLVGVVVVPEVGVLSVVVPLPGFSSRKAPSLKVPAGGGGGGNNTGASNAVVPEPGAVGSVFTVPGAAAIVFTGAPALPTAEPPVVPGVPLLLLPAASTAGSHSQCKEQASQSDLAWRCRDPLMHCRFLEKVRNAAGEGRVSLFSVVSTVTTGAPDRGSGYFFCCTLRVWSRRRAGRDASWGIPAVRVCPVQMPTRQTPSTAPGGWPRGAPSTVSGGSSQAGPRDRRRLARGNPPRWWRWSASTWPRAW